MTRPSRRVADYAPSTLERSAELVLAAAVEEAVALLRKDPRHSAAVYEAFDHWCPAQDRVANLLANAATAADLILGRAR
jgi:hypothetical protein